jgi:D-tyrosyl-tRNA(Tyr) deacylase
MRAVVQRVSEARVDVEGRTVGKIGRGLLVLVGIAEDDVDKDAEWLSEKVSSLRVFEDSKGKMNLSVHDVRGSILAVSQFTLLGDCRKGRRPSYDKAARPEDAEKLYRKFMEMVRTKGLPVEEGAFQARMGVHLVNDGPVTLILDSRKAF